MTPELYRQAGALFDRLRDLPDKDLRPTLDAACAGNAELRAQVMRLIEADRNAGSGGFLEGRAVEDAALLLTRGTPARAARPLGGCLLGSAAVVDAAPRSGRKRGARPSPGRVRSSGWVLAGHAGVSRVSS